MFLFIGCDVFWRVVFCSEGVMRRHSLLWEQPYRDSLVFLFVFSVLIVICYVCHSHSFVFWGDLDIYNPTLIVVWVISVRLFTVISPSTRSRKSVHVHVRTCRAGWHG